MTRRIRLFLLCLLMATLPLQGLAGVMKLACGWAHHHAPKQSAIDHDHGAHAHDHVPSVVAAVEEPAPGVDHGQAGSPVAGTCSACAACYTGGVVGPPIAIVSDSFKYPALAVSPPSSPWLAGFIPSGLERPPKSPSA